MSATDTRARDCRHLIGGKWADSAGGGRFDDLDPFTGDVVAHVPAGGREDARQRRRGRRRPRSTSGRRPAPAGARRSS